MLAVIRARGMSTRGAKPANGLALASPGSLRNAPEDRPRPARDPDLVARPQPVGQQQGFFRERPLPAMESSGGRRGIRLQRAVEWEATRDGAHCTRRASPVLGNCAMDARRVSRGLLAAQGIDQLALSRGQRLTGLDLKIGAHQIARLLLDGTLHVRADRADGHQSRHPEGERRGENQQPAAAMAAIAPGHSPHPGLKMKPPPGAAEKLAGPVAGLWAGWDMTAGWTGADSGDIVRRRLLACFRLPGARGLPAG